MGFTTPDGYAHCSREDYSGGLDTNRHGLYAHRLSGSCKCGVSHGADNVTQMPRILATYDYNDASGVLRFQVARLEPKDFRCRRPDGAGGWIWNMQGVDRTLYRLPELVADDSDRPVYIVEGEKDVDTLTGRGFTATCNPGGAGKWGAVAAIARRVLAGRDVVVVADRDEVGRKHAESVAASLRDVANVRVTEPPAPHKDATDLLRAGGSVEDFVEPTGTDGTDPEPPPPDPFEWKIWKAEEIYAQLPDIEWLVEDLLPVGTLTMVAAFGASLKSWAFVAELQSALAMGRPFLGRFALRQCKTLGIDFENGSYEYRRRLQRIARANGADRVEGTDFISMPSMSIGDPRFLPKLEAIAAEYDLIIIDTYAAGNSGVDENDARFAAPLNAMKAMAERTRKTFVVLHHTRKQKESEDERETTRGTSAIFNALDVELKIRRNKAGDFVCSQTKSRNSKGIEPFVIRLADVSEDATKVDIGMMEDEEAQAGSVSSSIGKKKALILKLLASDRDIRSENELFRRLKGRKSDVLSALAELVERGTVVKSGGTFRLTSEVET